MSSNNRGWDDPENTQIVLNPAGGIAQCLNWLMMTCFAARAPSPTKYATNTLGAALKLAQVDTFCASGIVPAGTTQSDATAIDNLEIFLKNSTVAGGATGLKMPNPATTGIRSVTIYYKNDNATPSSSFNLYPNVGANINALAVNAPVTFPVDNWTHYVYDNGTWNAVATGTVVP